MSETIAIRVENLNKYFGMGKSKRVHAVKNLNLEVPSGQVYGFLGPNGAGKTTTIRMLLDLVRPNTGSVSLFGKSVQSERAVLQRVGASVQRIAFYNFLSGRRNLEILALSSNLELPATHYEEVLEIVDMRERSHRRVGGYSTGMKQRLGIAAALLTNPDLIILDEPANGLDPQGISEIRQIIRELTDSHDKTVFLSSHQLNEVEQICDRVGIINRGELISEGRVADMLATQSQFRVRVTPLDKANAILSEHWTAVAHTDGRQLVVNIDENDAPTVVKKLVDNGIEVYEMIQHRQTLEEYFLTVTNGENSHVG